ncbi:hypothetical protein [Homoserinibacter sp. GY 40078]|uniref:hypothetical protein n=1 Tax=Homoserinibacter sp. GY 40078 TaxID=2603275 RepID=UPI0011C9DA12|nr:hypothetical protein [Homoserinibacter sp. GY 40078]TXK19758.1 hypothetical protein FVQ89_07830 [Homoserinibacter sp. GY 40078]
MKPVFRRVIQTVATASAFTVASFTLVAVPTSAAHAEAARDSIAESLAATVSNQTPPSVQIESSEAVDPQPLEGGYLLVAPGSERVAVIPESIDGDIEFASGLAVSLPTEAGAEDATQASTGGVVYEGSADQEASLVIMSAADSVRIHTVIHGPRASTEYTYSLEGGTPTLMPDGSVVIHAQRGDDPRETSAEIGSVEPPWAVDARGQSVPTRFEVRGNALVQIVDFDLDTAFPVVADPDFWWWAATTVGCAAEVAALVVAWAKLPSIIAKANKIISSSAKLQAAIKKLGGLKKSVELMRKYVQDRSKLTGAQRAGIAAAAGFGVSMFTDLLGVGTCVSLIRAIAKG